MSQTSTLKGSNWAPKRTEVIFRNKREAVEAEIARLREENPGKLHIGLRQMALSNILKNLTHTKHLALDAEVKRIQMEGNSEEEKRR